MAFQFRCPEGHLLEIDESHVGRECECPYCNTRFLVPEPPGSAPAEPNVEQDTAGVEQESPKFLLQQPSAAEQQIIHIPCPNGHVLETPREMLGQYAMCPYCQTEFQLRFEDSQEYRREKAEMDNIRERKLGKAWMNWAVVVAAVVLLAVIFMVVVAVSD